MSKKNTKSQGWFHLFMSSAHSCRADGVPDQSAACILGCVWHACWAASASYSLTHSSCDVHMCALFWWPEVLLCLVTFWWQSCVYSMWVCILISWRKLKWTGQSMLLQYCLSWEGMVYSITSHNIPTLLSSKRKYTKWILCGIAF